MLPKQRCPFCQGSARDFAQSARIAALRREKVMLREALKKAHACATLRADGARDGCPVSDALAMTELPT
jgi:hypothetical protein